MKIQKYFEEKANYIYGARLLKFAVIFLCILLAVNSVVTVSLYKSQKIIIIPPSISTQVFISGTDASDEYLKAMVRYVCQLTLNYNPAVARAQFNDFLKLVSPSVYPEYQKIFYDLATRIEAGNVSSAYYVTQIKVERQSGAIIVSGFLSQWTQDKQFITNETRQYKLKYKIEDGKFQVYEFKEYKEGERE